MLFLITGLEANYKWCFVKVKLQTWQPWLGSKGQIEPPLMHYYFFHLEIHMHVYWQNIGKLLFWPFWHYRQTHDFAQWQYEKEDRKHFTRKWISICDVISLIWRSRVLLIWMTTLHVFNFYSKTSNTLHVDSLLFCTLNHHTDWKYIKSRWAI